MITKIIHEDKIQKAHKYIEKGESFVIVTHVSPDGDAIGSALGLFHFLNAYGKENVSVIVPNDYPNFLKWMPGTKDVTIYEKYPEFSEQLISDAALNDAKQALVDLEAKHSQLGLNRAGVESKFYSEGALGELNPTLKTVLDILKGNFKPAFHADYFKHKFLC